MAMMILWPRARRISSSHGGVKNADTHRTTSGHHRYAAPRIPSTASWMAWSRSRNFRTPGQPHSSRSPVSARVPL